MRSARSLPCFLVALACCARPPSDPPAPANAAPPAGIPAPPPSAEPSAPPLADAAELTGIDEVARAAIARGDVTGAVVAVVRDGALAFHHAYGLRTRDPDRPMAPDTVFDLASLTKAIATAPSIHLLAEQNKLRLGDRVAHYLPAFAQNGKEAITIEELLLHTSGLPDDNALRDSADGPEKALQKIFALRPTARPGTRFLYSDLGYIVLGALIEKVSGEPLAAFAQKHLFAPLALHDTTFNPSPQLAARAAPTEKEGDQLLQGVVHDPRARRLGGAAGHAGLFSTAGDLARFAAMLLGGGEYAGTRVLAPATIARMTAPHALPDGGQRTLGWDVDTKFSGPRGELPGGYGHTGFTGTSIWIDPSTRSAVIVLTSRLYPDGKGDPRRLRREIANVVARAARKEPSTILTGIDVLERDGFNVLRGRRVGLVTHAAAVDRRGARTLDVLRRAPGVTLIALFSPEHGLAARDDRLLGDSRDPQSGLPVYSLYGEHRRPTAAQLAGVDTLVYDLQDAGARFYTYTTTLGYLLETAAQQRIRLVVLDRPNPIDGVHVDGPVLAPDKTSFTGYHPIPIRHGMTAGELAQLFNRERNLGADLQIIGVEGWLRTMTFDRTGLPWHNPSPNLRSLDEALLYPGVALLETTNVSVGRGTDRPFERVGAPWLDGAALASTLEGERLPGVRVTPTAFTPESSTFAGQRCRGVELRVTDRDRVEPIRLGIALARAIARRHPSEWQSSGYRVLLGDEPTLAALLRGEPVDRIVEGWQPSLKAFLEVRERYLLYRP